MAGFSKRKVLFFLAFLFLVMIVLSGVAWRYIIKRTPTIEDFVPIHLATAMPVSEQTTPEKWRNFSEGNQTWLHSSQSHLPETLALYRGLEVDIFPKITPSEVVLYVNHDKPEGSDLDAWLSTLKDPGNNLFWLDVKVLPVESKLRVLEKVKNTLNKYSIPFDHVILESRTVESLDVFTESGFLTSFYLDVPLKDVKKARELFESYVKRAENSKFVAVSCEMYGYFACTQCFPNLIYLQWGGYKSMPAYSNVYDSIARDKRVRVILERKPLPQGK